MSKLGTVYDKDLKQNVFYLRGEENYAHTTDITATMVKTLTSDSIVLSNWTITTYRDVGIGTVTIYNNDDVLAIYNWENGSTESTIANIELDYNIDNNIKVVYSGNSSCMGSEYTFDTINEVNTVAYSTNIVISSDNQYTHGETVIVTGSLICEGYMSLVEEQDIMIYSNNEYLTTATTGEDGVFSATLSNITSDGAYHLDFLFTGADVTGGRIASCNTSVEISKGCTVTVSDYPPIFYEGADNTISITVKDYLNQPINNQTVIFNSTSNTTNSSGVATYVFSTLEDTEYTITSDGATATYTPNRVVITNITEQYDGATFLSKTNVQSGLLSFRVDGENIQENIPIQLTVNKDGSVVDEIGVIYTDNTGVASTRITGSGYGACTLEASTPVASTEFSYVDYIEYGVANKTDALYQYNTYYPSNSLSALQSGWKITNNSGLSVLYNPMIMFEDFEVSFKVVSATSKIYLAWGIYSNNTISSPTVTELSLKANDVVYLTKSSDTLTLKVGTSTKGSIEYTGIGKSPFIGLNGATSQQLTFNNLKILRS